MTAQDNPTNPGAHGDPSGTGSTRERGRTADDVADRLASEGQAQVHHYRDVAADKVDRLAESIDAAADELRGDEQTAYLSRHVGELSDSLARLSRGLREKSTDEILADVTRIARDNPGLFLAGSVALGFGIARFARASGDERERSGRPHDDRRSDRTGSDWLDRTSEDIAASHAQGRRSATSNVPGTAGHPARGNDTVDTTAPHGTRGAGSAVAGPAAGPGVMQGSPSTDPDYASRGTRAGDYPRGNPGATASGGTDVPPGYSAAPGSTDTPQGRT